MLHYGHTEALPDADVVYVQQEPSGFAGHGQASVWTLLLSQYATTGTNRWGIQVPPTQGQFVCMFYKVSTLSFS